MLFLLLEALAAVSNTHNKPTLQTLTLISQRQSHQAKQPNTPTKPNTLWLRDGEVVIYKRSRSSQYQCRYKLLNGKWHRQSTGKASIEQAIAIACELYDQARFRQRQGLTHKAHSFAHIANELLAVLEHDIGKQRNQSVKNAYASCIRQYFLPYFKHRTLEDITARDLQQFEVWRDRRSNRTLKFSTQQNFVSAWNRLVDYAAQQDYIPEQHQVPRFTNKGQRSQARPGFTQEEVDRLMAFMNEWRKGGKQRIEFETRPLCCDYVEMLLLTGMRHGTEAMGLKWKHCAWHYDKGVRYLRLWVDGKTGGRWLIAKHAAVDVLRRLHSRQKDICETAFEDLFEQQIDKRVFRFSTGQHSGRLALPFERLMRDSGLHKDSSGQNRTLYSLRHTYATLELLRGTTDIHTLAKQLGNSVAMIERYYSKLTATMAAGKLA